MATDRTYRFAPLTVADYIHLETLAAAAPYASRGEVARKGGASPDAIDRAVDEDMRELGAGLGTRRWYAYIETMAGCSEALRRALARGEPDLTAEAVERIVGVLSYPEAVKKYRALNRQALGLPEEPAPTDPPAPPPTTADGG